GKYKGESPDKISISPSEAEELINAIKTKTKKAEVTRELTNSIIIEKKIKQVNLTLSQDIYRNAEASGVTLSKGVEELIKSDLEMQTKEMAKSGLSTTEIKDRNQGYLRAIYTAISTNSLNKASFDKASFDKARYQNAKSIIFKPLIKLTITSSPEGSDVEVSNTPIGKTAIQEKQFESNKEYTFIFRLPGYKISERKYFVNSYPPQQKLDEILIKEE
ncbi:MAG: hypothetical protein Q7T83_00145, partial [Thermodesulfovibrionales bacterium]|nr:hypothetical protein [Thermodesulfovibrionales bacterium]